MKNKKKVKISIFSARGQVIEGIKKMKHIVSKAENDHDQNEFEFNENLIKMG